MTETKRCKKCGFRKRGADHDKGTHHKGKRIKGRKIKPSLTRPSQ